MARNFAPGSASALNYLRQLLVAEHVNPDAAQAVFSVEGASGGIGDGGHAFGPGQFNNAGGVWTGRYGGMSPQQINQIAWSPTGLQELAQRVGKVAGGIKNPTKAVQRIVTQFERPADPRGEVAKALSRLGKPMSTFNAAWGTPGLGGKGKPLPPPPGLIGDGKQALLGNLVAQQNAFLSGQDYNGPSLAQQMQQFNLMQQAQGGSPFFSTPKGVGPVTYPPTSDGKGGLGPLRLPGSGKSMVKFLGNTKGENSSFLNALSQAVSGIGGTQVKITSGFRDPQHNAAVGGVQHSLHMKGDALDGYALIGGKWVPLGTALLPVAKKYGLRSGDVAGFFNGGKDPVHVDYGASLGM
jgi:hypothetical protein